MGLFFIGLGLLRLLAALFIILLAVKAAGLLFAALERGREKTVSQKAELILRRRFAEGDIEASDYQERLQVLRKGA